MRDGARRLPWFFSELPNFPPVPSHSIVGIRRRCAGRGGTALVEAPNRQWRKEP
ncbi:hypothetical protein ATKI12_4945 [Kitasatospora sp. Ki12]